MLVQKALNWKMNRAQNALIFLIKNVDLMNSGNELSHWRVVTVIAIGLKIDFVGSESTVYFFVIITNFYY